MRALTVMVLALLLGTALAGCSTSPFRPVVDEAIVRGSEFSWSVEELPEASGGTFKPSSVETVYRFDPDDGDGLPALLSLVGIHTATRLDTTALRDEARIILADALAAEGVTIDDSQERIGTRTLQSGASTDWVLLVGTARATGPGVFFEGDEELRALGEAWYDADSKTHVVAIAIGQTTGVGLIGNEERDHRAWDQLVGDDDGSITQSIHSEGFIDHVRSN